MRRNKINFIFDTAFWFIIMILPLLISGITTLSFSKFNLADIQETKVITNETTTIYDGTNFVVSDKIDGLGLTVGTTYYFQVNSDEPLKVYHLTGYIVSYTYFKLEDNVVYYATAYGNTSPSSWNVFADNTTTTYIGYSNIYAYTPTSTGYVSDNLYRSYTEVPNITHTSTEESSFNNSLVDKLFYNLDFVNNELSLNDNIIYNGFKAVVGSNGIIPLLNDNSFTLKYLSYVIIVLILHVFFDLLAFIPRLAHSLNDKFYNVGGVK